jgi:hypothetical protein
MIRRPPRSTLIFTLFPDTTRAAAAGAFGPNDDWIEGVGHRPWQGITRGHQLGQSAIRHNTAHMGEGVTVRGLTRFGLGG